jgi:Tol biopolymer transport system component
MFDLSPAVSPSGKTVAVASLQNRSWKPSVKTVAVASLQNRSWKGELDNLKTDIYLMNVDSEESEGLGRRLLIKNGGWPSWGSDNIIFFHRGGGTTSRTLGSGKAETTWGVFRYNISSGETVQVTPVELDAVTPAAISETKVAVATIRPHGVEIPHRHIEIFDTSEPALPSVRITQGQGTGQGNHYNPFVLEGSGRIGYHRCRRDLTLTEVEQYGENLVFGLDRLNSPVKDVGLYRLSGMSVAISKDGSKLACIGGGDFNIIRVADSVRWHDVYKHNGPRRVFSPVWNLNPDKDILYFCIGTSFEAHDPLEIYAINNASGDMTEVQVQRLTYGGFNNAFPSSSPDGKRVVFRSTRDFSPSQPTSSGWWKLKSPQLGWGDEGSSQQTRGVMTKDIHKNLYIMVNTESTTEEGWVTRLTKGEWTDTHCQWSPNGDWVVFSSTRGKPKGANTLPDNELLLGYCSVYLVKVGDPTVVIRVMNGRRDFGGHISHPVFSPDGRSIAVMADFAAVSVEPVSLTMFNVMSRVHNDIFLVDIDPDDKKQNKDMIKGIRRITHSRFDCGAPAWTSWLATGPSDKWNMFMHAGQRFKPLFRLRRSFLMRRKHVARDLLTT